MKRADLERAVGSPKRRRGGEERRVRAVLALTLAIYASACGPHSDCNKIIDKMVVCDPSAGGAYVQSCAPGVRQLSGGDVIACAEATFSKGASARPTRTSALAAGSVLVLTTSKAFVDYRTSGLSRHIVGSRISLLAK
jgi:hypothetical protein